MNTLPTVNPNLARAASFFIVWRTAPSSARLTIQAVVKQYAKRTPELREALEEVARLYDRIRRHDKEPIPVEQRTSIDAKDISIFFAMTQNRAYARALAFATLWRDGDVILRSELEQLIRSEVQAAPSFRAELEQAVTQLEQYIKTESNRNTFI